MNSYYYIDATTQQQVGPFPASQLYSKNIRPETMVWCAGMGDWMQAQSVEDLNFLFNSTSQNSTSQSTQNEGNATGQQPQYQQPQTQYQQHQPQQGQYQQPQNQFGGTNNPFGNPFNGVDVRPMPKNWLIESILVTVLCCLPFGIAGIVNATKVESRYYSGDYDGAVEAGNSAKKWCLYSLIGWAVVIVLYIGFFAVAAGMGSL